MPCSKGITCGPDNIKLVLNALAYFIASKMFIKLTPGQKGSLHQAQARHSHDSAPFSCSLLSTNACTVYATRCTPEDTFRGGTRPSRWTSHRPWPRRARWTVTRPWSSRLSHGEDMTQLQQQAALVIKLWRITLPHFAIQKYLHIWLRYLRSNKGSKLDSNSSWVRCIWTS